MKKIIDLEKYSKEDIETALTILRTMIEVGVHLLPCLAEKGSREESRKSREMEAETIMNEKGIDRETMEQIKNIIGILIERIGKPILYRALQKKDPKLADCIFNIFSINFNGMRA